MTVHPKVTWAELTSDHEVLLIPARAWERVLLPDIADYESSWDGANGTWILPAKVASRIAADLENLSEPEFSRAIEPGHFESQELNEGSLSATSHLTAPVRSDVLSFLRNGAIRWRFIGT
jgi:hypothetical protein